MMGRTGGGGSSPPFHSGMQKPWSSVRWCDTDGSKSRSIAVCRMWLASFGCPEIFLKGQSFIHGSAGPSCSSPMPMQMLGRLSMKKFTQWSGAISTRTSGRAALMRRPSSVSARVRSRWLAGLTSFQPRMMSGAWLDAYTPTSSAMARSRRGGGPGGPHFSQEFRFGHAGDHEVETQKVGVDARSEERDVVALDGGAHFGLQGIAVEDLPPVSPVFLAERSGTLKIEEELAQPVISHERYSAMSEGGGRNRPRARAVRGYFPPRSLVKGTNLTGRVRLVVAVPSGRFSTSRSCCASWVPPTGITIRPPGLSWSTSGFGISPGAAVTMIESKGAASGQPL